MAAKLLDVTQPIQDVPWAVVDVETTGFQYRGADRICEVAIWRRSPDGGNVRTYHSLVNPERLLSDGARDVNGLNEETLATAPVFAAIVADVVEWLTGAVVIAHNAPFDMGFLRAEFVRAGVPGPAVQVLDTLALARRFWRLPSNKLVDVAATLNISTAGAHRAEDDARMTLKLFEALVSCYGYRGYETTLGALLLAQARRYQPASRKRGRRY